MTDFQDTLDDAIEKREKDEHKKETKQKLASFLDLFSLNAFLEGLLIAASLVLVIIIWAWISADAFYTKLEGRLPAKSTVIEQSHMITPNQITNNGDTIILHMPKASSVETVPLETNAAPLSQSPITGLYENLNGGKIAPIKNAETGETPFKAYSRPFDVSPTLPKLSFIITDMGISPNKTREIISILPSDITLSFSPYAPNLKQQTDTARNAGHEVWITLPLETKDYPATDPGRLTLLLNASVEQNKNRLQEILSMTDGYSGFIASKDHTFTPEDGEINPAIDDIFNRGLAIIDSNPMSSNFVGTIGARQGYPYGQNNFWMDEQLGEQQAYLTLRQAADFTTTHDHVTVMLRPYPSSIKALYNFLNSPMVQQFQLAPASALVQHD